MPLRSLQYILVLLPLVWPAGLSARPPGTAAQLDSGTVAASQTAATLLHVTAPGRFALTVHSGSGASLQLVDQLAGPGEVAGIPGVQDGRVDALLDSGTYKLRVVSAPHATGTVALTATPFRDAAPLQTLLPNGDPVAGSLGDLQQRRFWLVVPEDGHVRLVASGRALADLRLWRDGRDLVDAPPQARPVEPVQGHPMTELAIGAEIEPGTYMVTAYGGVKLTWADGDASTPFFIRAGSRRDLAGAWVSGTIGASGLEIFAVPDWAAALRLDLPKSAPVTLAAGDAEAEVETRSREPWTVLTLPPTPQGTAHPDPARLADVQLRGFAGQAYRLRVLGRIGDRNFATPGTWWVSAATQGMGGDEVPPGLLLERQEWPVKTRILADTLPHVGPGQAWRARFNLRGRTVLPVQAQGGGKLSLRTEGVALDRTIDPQSYVDVAADLLDLSLVPAEGAVGALDVTFGPPGQEAGLAKPYPPDPVVPFGEQPLAPQQSLVLDGPRAPGAAFGLSVRPSPVDLADEPLLAAQMPGQVLRVPVAGGAGPIEVRAVGEAGPVAVTRAEEQHRTILTVPAPAEPRTLVLSRSKPTDPQPAPAPRAAAALPRIDGGRPVFLTLRDNAPRSFALHLAEGGLYSVETLGRLHTAERLGTSFVPTIATDDGTGPGHNARLQPWLRAGDYRVTVTARDSAGHVGLLATPAPLLPGPALLPGGTARATLPAGQGVVLPIEVAHAGRYRMTLLGRAATFQARLDDGEGWPLTAPGPFTNQEMMLQPGRYRLLVTPGPADARLVASMKEVLPPTIIAGHGPHTLPIGETLTATWREPPSPAAPRTPDTFVFSLAGPAHAHLRLGKGMGGLLIPAHGAPIRAGETFDSELTPGDWRLDLRAEGRNDRLDYTVALTTDEVQPGRARQAALPSTHDFSLAADRVVTLSTQGSAPVRAVLRAAGGAVLARSGARDHDWNTVLSQRLPAGRYTVEVLPGAAPDTVKIPADTALPTAEDANRPTQLVDTPAAPDNAASDKAAPDSTEMSDTPAGENAAPDDSQKPDPSASDAPQPSDAPEPARNQFADRDKQTTLTLSLPPDLPAVPAAETQVLDGAGVHLLGMAPPQPGSLIVASVRPAAGSGTAMLALERQESSGAWRQVTQSSGAAPFVAAMADAAPAPWRVAIWTLDPGLTLAATIRSLADAPAARAETVPELGLAVARLPLSNPAVSSVRGPAGLLQASWPGYPAVPLDAGRAVPQGDVLWLIGRQAGPVSLAPAERPWTFDLPAGAHAALPRPRAASGTFQVWRADSGDGQPVWAAGRDAVAPHSAVTVGLPLLSAGGSVARIEVGRADLPAPALRTLASRLSETLSPHTALRISVPAGGGDLLLSLAPNTAAFLDDAAGVWAPAQPVTRRVKAPKTMLLVNLGDAAGAVSVEPVPHTGPDALAAGQVFSAFHGAAGSLDLPADIVPDTHIALAGEGELLVRDARGRVLTGRDIAPAPGRANLTVSYGPGASVLWLEAPGHSPWPRPAPASVPVPSSQALRGPAMAFSVPASGPTFLHASTTAPVLLGVDDATPELFAAGAEFHRAIPGNVVLNIMPAQDGPLSGTISLWTEALRPAREGLGEAVLVPPGGSAAFAFTLARPSRVGIGVRANPDLASVRLLDASGRVVGEGAAQLRDLAAGRYVIEARVPPDSAPTSIRPALLGTVPRPSGPPGEVAAGYLELAGLRSAKP